ncbi:MAG: hypothetical protein K5762_07535 [Bacilli bacterium]|jgi:hypothetical protein|nr:hypothetical protein [Bacilli bacterium]
MLTEKQINSLDAYFGFALRKRAVYVGQKMEEMLGKKKADFLLLLPSCTEKKEAELSKYQEKNPHLVIYRYTGSYDVKAILGYELLNAVCITDPNLASAIHKVLQEDK